MSARQAIFQIALGLSGVLGIAGCRAAPQQSALSTPADPIPAGVPAAAVAPASAVQSQVSEPAPLQRVAAAVDDPSSLVLFADETAEVNQPRPAPSEAGVDRPFAVPPELPGAGTPPIQLPPADPNQTPGERRALIEEVYQLLPALPPPALSAPDAAARPFTLSDLEQLAYQNSPVIREAWFAVENARGQATQAGLCPNPEMGYKADGMNTAHTAGHQGVFVAQTFITAGKLTLAQQRALMLARAAEFAYIRARFEVAADVRRGYFDVLVAQERVKLNLAMAALTREAYEMQIDLLASGQVATYEPLQLRVLAMQARNQVVRAENDYAAAWRDLSATLSFPEMQPVALAGDIEAPAPDVAFDAARAVMLGRHTDLAIAQAEIEAAGWNLELQEVTPIPNVNVAGVAQYDDTSPDHLITYNLQIGLPLPLLNRNQGNIASAGADVMRTRQGWVTTRNRLSSELAEIYARYASGRELAAAYQDEIVPSQVRTFRAVNNRYRGDAGEIDFGQLVVAQQTLASVVNEYLAVLGNQWTATADLSEILQANNLFSMDGLAAQAPPIEPPPPLAER